MDNNMYFQEKSATNGHTKISAIDKSWIMRNVFGEDENNFTLYLLCN
jgi:hypothetical protein